MAGPRFVEVPSDRFQAALDEIGKAVEAKGGSATWTKAGRERVWELRLPARGGSFVRMVRVFTSMAIGAAQARDCGEDAVRVVVGFETDKGFKPVEAGQKILRTAPAAAPDRPGIFLDRLRDNLRSAYTRATKIQTCPSCGRPMVERAGKTGGFYGCTGFPECRVTRPI